MRIHLLQRLLTDVIGEFLGDDDVIGNSPTESPVSHKFMKSSRICTLRISQELTENYDEDLKEFLDYHDEDIWRISWLPRQ